MKSFASLCGAARFGQLVLAMLCLTVGAHAQIESGLEGIWMMDDHAPALINPANPERFVIQRVMPGETQWADGSFFLRWPSEPRPERGYFSNKNGRVWITTYRWVNNERVRVEYRGEIRREAGKVTWEGTASTTGGKRTIWEFVATRTE